MRPGFLALFLLAAPPLSAWGALGHRLLAVGALRDLPPGLAGWYRGREGEVADHAVDPDRWRASDPLEGPRHYLDSEAYGGPAAVPRDPEAAWARLGPAGFLRAGQVPWVIQARALDLVRAFQAGDRERVLRATAWLSHYVGDLQVPLHTTADSDGEGTGQAGIHARWESDLLARLEAQDPFRPEVRPAEPGPDPLGLPWRWLEEAYGLVEEVLAADRTAQAAAAAAGEPGYGPVYWALFEALQGARLRDRLTLSAQRTADLVRWAWNAAGSPGAGL